MEYMTTLTYQSMTAQDKLNHYRESPVITESKSFMNANAKTNDPPDKKVVVLHRAVCGGIIVSNWKPTEKEALEDASKCVAVQMSSLLQQIEAEKS